MPAVLRRTAGTLGTLNAPVASTTVAALPLALVGDRDPVLTSSVRRTEVTVVAVWTGAATCFAYADDELDDLGHGHEAVGFVAVVRVPGQPALPVGREETERIPSLGRHELATSPRSSTTWSIDRSERRRLMARPPWPAPMTTVVVLIGAAPQQVCASGQTTSTRTSVGLVMMS